MTVQQLSLGACRADDHPNAKAAARINRAPARQAVLDALARYGPLNSDQIAAKTGRAQDTTRSLLVRMLRDGDIRDTGATRPSARMQAQRVVALPLRPIERVRTGEVL